MRLGSNGAAVVEVVVSLEEQLELMLSIRSTTVSLSETIRKMVLVDADWNAAVD